MNILLVQETDWKDRGPLQQHHLVERLVHRGYDIRIIDFNVGWSSQQSVSVYEPRLEMNVESKTIDGVITRLIRPAMLRIPVICYLIILFTHAIEIINQVKKKKPHVIIGMGILNTFIASLYARIMNIPFVYYWIDSYHELIPEKFFRVVGLVLEKFILNISDLCMSINDELRDYQCKLSSCLEKTKVIPAGICVELFNPKKQGQHIRLKIGASPCDKILFFMGWFYESSGLLEVAQEVIKLDSSKGIKLFIVGQGQLKEKLLMMSKTPRAKGRIIVCNWVNYKILSEYVSASDICLLPAHLNNLMRHIVPIKVYEYMACGKPVVSTKLPGVIREFGYENGIVYASDPTDVVKKSLQIIETNQLEDLGHKAAEFVLKRDWNLIVNQFISTLRQLIKK